MNELTKIAAANQQRAREVIRDSGLEAAWRSVGAEPNLVGSLRTGLLMTHHDIDFHIYSSPLRLADSFAAMARLAENSRIRSITFNNLLDAPDQCLEWHAWYADADDQLWQIDMIHMPRGSAYDGYFERVADRIAAVRARNETRRRFYFGNLDAYRMVANNAFQAPFTVPKQHWRADPYDNQVGEIETAERGLGYGEFERSKEVLLCEELPL